MLFIGICIFTYCIIFFIRFRKKGLDIKGIARITLLYFNTITIISLIVFVKNLAEYLSFEIQTLMHNEIQALIYAPIELDWFTPAFLGCASLIAFVFYFIIDLFYNTKNASE